MTHETKIKVKMDFYEESKKQAVQCLRGMGAEVEGETDPNTWEGVMQMVSDVIRHGNADKQASAIMAAAKWSWANCECQVHRHVSETKEMIEKEVSAAKEGDAAGEEAAPVTKAIPPAVTAAALMK